MIFILTELCKISTQRAGVGLGSIYNFFFRLMFDIARNLRRTLLRPVFCNARYDEDEAAIQPRLHSSGDAHCSAHRHSLVLPKRCYGKQESLLLCCVFPYFFARFLFYTQFSFVTVTLRFVDFFYKLYGCSRNAKYP